MKRLVLLACVLSLMVGGAATLVRARAQAGAVSPIERLDPEADAILPAGATIEVIRQDFFGATEGATWVPDGGYLAFSDMGSNR
ncbi:MAG: hypothetical protein AB7N29_23610, partial [Vicinamibacterales bacterium]